MIARRPLQTIEHRSFHVVSFIQTIVGQQLLGFIASSVEWVDVITGKRVVKNVALKSSMIMVTGVTASLS